MCSMSVLCPLCAQTSFSSIDALRCSLIKAANGPLACPICNELFLGLDKLTIHLFSHTNIMYSGSNANDIKTPTSHNQNIENIEKLKAQQIEKLNHLKNNNHMNSCHDTKLTQTHLNEEVTFANTHHVWEKNTLNESQKAEERIVNKPNSTRQHQQVVGCVGRDEQASADIKNLAQCDVCEFTFRNEELKNMHMRLVHENFECHASSSSASAVGVSSNMTMNHDFRCHLCAKTFKSKGSLRIHLKVMHLIGLPYVNNTPQFTICDRIRHKENKMLKSANPVNNLSQTQNDKLNNTTLPTADLKDSQNCNLLNISPVKFISNLNSISATSNIGVLKLNQPLEFHQDNLDNSTLQASNLLLVFNTAAPSDVAPNFSSINQNGSSNSPTNTMAMTSKNNEGAAKLISNVCSVTENPKIWECDVCSKAFTTKYFLKKHKRLHTGEMPYSCGLCTRTFTFQQSYHKHLLYHSDEKPHVCSTCGRAFKELSTLHNHERIHSGEKPFKCEICDKSFRQRVSFLVHNRIHTGVMPYKCEICQRSFRYKVSQRTHKCQLLSTAASSPPPQEENDNVSESFIKTFLETSATGHNHLNSHLQHSQNSPASNEIADINEKASSLNEQQALLTKTIDDIVVESCNKIGIVNEPFATEQIVNEGSMSPSEKLQNMRLYSPQLVTPDLNGIEGDLTRFFLENTQTDNNLL